MGETTRPAAATAIAVGLFVEAVMMLGVGIWISIAAMGEPLDHLGGSLFLAVLCLASAFFLVQAGRGMLQGHAWSRSAALAWQVLQLGVALGTFNGAEGNVPVALALAALSITILVLIFRKSVSAFLRRERPAA